MRTMTYTMTMKELMRTMTLSAGTKMAAFALTFGLLLLSHSNVQAGDCYSKNNTESMTLTAEKQAKMSPTDALLVLQEGNKRFISNQSVNRDLLVQIEHTSTGQFPFASVVSCIDSRIPTEIVFDQGIGDVFNARIAGNFVNEDILGSLEFASKVAGSKLIVVMGHTSCGAVKGACDGAELGNLTQMLKKISPAVDAVETPKGTDRSSANIDFVNDVAAMNVEMTIEKIKKDSPVLKELYDQGKLDIVGAMYDVKTGVVTFM